MTASIRITEVSKSFKQETTVLSKVSLEIEEGSFVVLVGPSGCGKSTLLNMTAGLLSPTSGKIYYKERLLTDPCLEIGYLTQKDTLMPWRNVERNVEMPLEIRGVRKRERRGRAHQIIERVGLKGSEKLYPHELSGGML